MKPQGYTQEESFKPIKINPDLWLRLAGNCYEYICVYINDLLVIMKEPQKFFNNLKTKYKYKLKGVGDPQYHVGGDFGQDSDGTLFWELGLISRSC